MQLHELAEQGDSKKADTFFCHTLPYPKSHAGLIVP